MSANSLDVCPSVSEIKAEVCRAFRVQPIDMGSHRRGQSVARPRQIAMWLTRKLTPLSLPAIGRHFGDRDHTTVMHAIRRVEALAAADAEFGERLEHLRSRLSDPARRAA